MILRILQKIKSVNLSQVLYQPADPWRKNDAIMTSKRSRFDIEFTSLLHRVPVRQACLAKFNFLFFIWMIGPYKAIRLACRNDCCVSFGYINNENYTGGQNNGAAQGNVNHDVNMGLWDHAFVAVSCRNDKKMALNWPIHRGIKRMEQLT